MIEMLITGGCLAFLILSIEQLKFKCRPSNLELLRTLISMCGNIGFFTACMMSGYILAAKLLLLFQLIIQAIKMGVLTARRPLP